MGVVRYLLVLQTEEERLNMLHSIACGSVKPYFDFKVNMDKSEVSSENVNWKLIVINSKCDALRTAGLLYSAVYYYPECNLDEETKSYLESRCRNPSV